MYIINPKFLYAVYGNKPQYSFAKTRFDFLKNVLNISIMGALLRHHGSRGWSYCGIVPGGTAVFVAGITAAFMTGSTASIYPYPPIPGSAVDRVLVPTPDNVNPQTCHQECIAYTSQGLVCLQGSTTSYTRAQTIPLGPSASYFSIIFAFRSGCGGFPKMLAGIPSRLDHRLVLLGLFLRFGQRAELIRKC
jgi:hypothetical protein